jgi:hypothetical protein
MASGFARQTVQPRGILTRKAAAYDSLIVTHIMVRRRLAKPFTTMKLEKEESLLRSHRVHPSPHSAVIGLRIEQIRPERDLPLGEVMLVLDRAGGMDNVPAGKDADDGLGGDGTGGSAEDREGADLAEGCS